MFKGILTCYRLRQRKKLQRVVGETEDDPIDNKNGNHGGGGYKERVGSVIPYIPSFFHLTRASPTKKVLSVLCPVLLTCHETGWFPQV